MQKIEAIIRPTKIHDVKAALENAKFESMTITDVTGRGKQRGMIHQWRGREYCVDLLPKIKVEIVVPESKVDEVVGIIMENASTGEVGDGKIFIYPVERAIRIRTGETDGDAL